MFQPVGGMDAIGKAFAKEVGDIIQYDAKVTRIQQDDRGVMVTYTNPKAPATAPATLQQAKADWCVCTIPLSILSQLPVDVGAPMKAAIDAVPTRGRSRSACNSSAASGKRTRRSTAASA